jgi:transposase
VVLYSSRFVRWYFDRLIRGIKQRAVLSTRVMASASNEVQLAKLAEHLQNGPQAHGYATALWTTERIAKLIHRQFGVRYHRDHVGRLMGQMGWSCQRPTGRARERKEEEISRWKRVEWPRIKKKPKKRGAP